MAYSGRFKPTNPEKYIGDHTNIIYRSSWECRVMSWLDKNPDILSWGSEELIIPYKSPVDGRFHRYFPDFIVKTRNKTLIIEVKPERETKEPKPRKRVTKQYLQEVMTYGARKRNQRTKTQKKSHKTIPARSNDLWSQSVQMESSRRILFGSRLGIQSNH